MRTQQPTVTIKTDPDLNKVVRDGKGLQVSSLKLYLTNEGVDLDIRTVSGYTPVTLIIPRDVLTKLATSWLQIDAAKRLLKKWRTARTVEAAIVQRLSKEGLCQIK